MAEADLHLPQTENVASQIKDLFAIRREEQTKWDPDAIKRGGFGYIFIVHLVMWDMTWGRFFK